MLSTPTASSAPHPCPPAMRCSHPSPALTVVSPILLNTLLPSLLEEVTMEEGSTNFLLPSNPLVHHPFTVQAHTNPRLCTLNPTITTTLFLTSLHSLVLRILPQDTHQGRPLKCHLSQTTTWYRLIWARSHPTRLHSTSLGSTIIPVHIMILPWLAVVWPNSRFRP